MTEKEIAKYKKLDELFVSECERVARILALAKENKGGNSDPTFASSFHIGDSKDGDTVFWEGDEYWRYQGHEHHDGDFPAAYLTMTDDELREIVKKKNDEYNARAVEALKKKEETMREERRKEYERLKKEFEE